MQKDALIQTITSYYPEADTSRVRQAIAFARAAHEGQYRDSGEEFFQHPYEVARILAELQMDVDTIVAGLLHDVLEDTDVTRERMEERFGPEVVGLVDGVTKLTKISFKTKEEQQARSLRKMFIAMAEDLRVIVIKLADRLHNMRTLRHLSVDRQRRIAAETLEIYAPLAHRLGVWSMKWELEDLAFRALNPEEYADLVRQIARRREEREQELNEVISRIEQNLADLNIKGSLQGRPKHLYSIYQKIQRQGTDDLSEVYDLLAVRIIVDSVKDCYGVLGLVHTLWKPVPGRFKDYIAMPKSNLYQSLHTTVVGPSGEPLEIQIRTDEMHRIAEMGIAAHWLYKEGRTSSEFEEKVAWLRQVMEWLREMKDPQEFMETLKIDLFEDEVFVFTPRGDVKNLPAGATPIDFAFAVHTDVGMHTVGAKVNGKMVALDHRLQNGEFVEIMTSKNARPSQDWLNLVHTSKARSKIRSYFNQMHREESVQRGKEVLAREADRLGLEDADLFATERMQDVARRYGLVDAEDVYAAVGFGKVSTSQVLGRLIGRQELEALRRRLRESRRRNGRARTTPAPETGVRVVGIDNVLVRFSRCCNPVPGDKIIGYITRGRGVSIHRADCPNMTTLDDEGRRIAVQWEGDTTGTYPVEIYIEAIDRANLLANIMESLADSQANIGGVNARTDRQKHATINLTVDIQNIEHMQMVMERIKRVDGVINVFRTGSG